MYESKKWVFSGISSLLTRTFGIMNRLNICMLLILSCFCVAIRRQWICDENPPVKDILKVFTCLTEPNLVREDIFILFLKSLYTIYT